MSMRPIVLSYQTDQAHQAYQSYLNHPDAVATGSVTRNRVPTSAALLTSMRPSCASTIFRTIASPRPVPVTFVVKNGLKILSVTSAGTPGPSSATSTITAGGGGPAPTKPASASILPVAPPTAICPRPPRAP